MDRRIIWIVLGAVGLLGAVFFGVMLGAAAAFVLFQARPASAEARMAPLERAVQIAPQQAGETAGILIAGVDPESPAAAAGLVRGDIVLEINGQAVTEQPFILWQLLEDVEPGEEIELLVQHGDEQHTVSVPLEEQDGQPYLGIQTCALGMWMGDGPGQQEFRFSLEPGATIAEVVADSPAAEAGLQAGDRITALDGQEIGAGTNLGDLIAEREPGDTVTLQVVGADGEERSVEVTLGENPDEAGKAYLGIRYQAAPDLRPFDGETPPQFELPFGEEGQMPRFGFGQGGGENLPFFMPGNLPEGVTAGAVIGEVVEGSPAAESGLQTGDLITALDGQPVAAAGELVELVQAREPGDEVTLEIYRPGEDGAQEITVTLGENPDQAGSPYLGVAVGTFSLDMLNNGESGSTPGDIPFELPPFIHPFIQPEQEAPTTPGGEALRLPLAG